MSFSRELRTAVALLFFLPALACHDYTFRPDLSSGEIGIYDDLFAVSVVNEQTVFAAGYFGAIYRSQDGGETWGQQETNTTFSIYDISMADENNGWAVGQIGIILHTDDGGATWTPQENPKSQQQTNLFSVQAVDANTAWSVGEWGSIITTINGGRTWQDHSLSIGLDDPSFQWLRPSDQEKVRNGEMVFRDVGLNDIFCRPLPSQSCWIAGEYGKLFYSQDGGHVWSEGKISGTTELPPLAFQPEGTTIAEEERVRLSELVQEIIASPHLKIEIDPFVTKAEIASHLAREDGDPTSLFELVEERAGEANSVLVDEGMFRDRIFTEGYPPWDWEELTEEDPQFLNRYLTGRTKRVPTVGVRVLHRPYLFHVRFDDDQRGLVAGLGGILLETNDGGLTWAYSESTTQEALFAATYSANRLIAVGEKGLVRVASKADVQWEKPRAGFPKLFSFFRDVSFEHGGQVGFMVGQKGTILRSTDAGGSWEQVLPLD
jgi:photosystem II stability/assembly factor-like uncharacterized protein